MDEQEMLVPRKPPQSLEAEKSVIASMLYSSDAIADVAGKLTSDDFYQHQYGIMYDTILELNEDVAPVPEKYLALYAIMDRMYGWE